MASWLDGSASSSKVADLALDTAVAGEPIEVLVSVSNPLALEISVSAMRLTFEAEPGSEAASSGAGDETAASEGAPAASEEAATDAVAASASFAQARTLCTCNLICLEAFILLVYKHEESNSFKQQVFKSGP